MKIGIDISSVIYGTGVSVYTKELVRSLLNIDERNEYVLYGGSLRRKSELEEFVRSVGSKNVVSKILPIAPTLGDIIWNRLHFGSIEWFIGQVDVFHSSDWTQPPSNAYKVTTVHDLSPIKYEKQMHSKIVSVHKRKLKWVKKEVDRIIVPSIATKKELIELKYDETKIVVIPEAAESFFKPSKKIEIDKVKKKFKIKGKYLFTIGVRPRKNTKRLIEAFKIFNKEKEYTLVLAGKPTNIEVREEGDIKLLGHIIDSELVALFSGAEATVYPSLYEGFGLTILQAMACGSPVVTSNTSSMPEVAGDAAVLVDPNSTKSISDGIMLALNDKERLIKMGRMQSKKFTWEKAAVETLKVYKFSEKQ